MKKSLLLIMTFLFVGFGYGQSTFEKGVKNIKREIEAVTMKEKQDLQLKVVEINKELDQKNISTEQAEEQKLRAAELCASNIEQKVRELEQKLQKLIQKEVEATTESGMLDKDDSDNDDNYESGTRKMGGGVISYRFPKNWNENKVKEEKYKFEPRTTSQGVFAFGLNNIVSGGGLSSIENNGIKVSNSRFYEWGLTWKTRLSATSSLLALKYGLSLTYNNLRPDNNSYYEKNGLMTNLVEHPFELRDEPYFRMTNLVLPVHLEFDFSKSKKSETGKYIARANKGVRLGVGGYAGINTRTKQIEEYSANGQRVEKSTRGDFNTNNLIYGLSAYLGYGDVALYTKYDINPIFTDNTLKQHNVSVGIRFDFD